jgi:phage FluMu protein Com
MFEVIHTFLVRLKCYVSMKVKCPDCDGKAELSDNFSFVRCDQCHLDLTYGEYVRYIGKKNPVYKNILSDYKQR